MIGKVNISTGGANKGIEPNNVSNISVKAENGKVTIKWSDPENKVIDGQTVAIWKGTKLIYKAGSAPVSEKDGIQILDNQVQNQYSTNGFVINGLTNGTKYYFALFPYSTTGAINTNANNILSATPILYRTMTAVIDLSNSNPATCVTYEDDAVGMEAKSDEWDEFFGHYPVLFKEGEEVSRLNRNDFAQFEDGTSADITSSNAGDVMIAFPRHGLSITKEDNKVKISMTDNPDDQNFQYYAHIRGDTRKEVFYLGAYKGYVSSNKLRSLSGKKPTEKNTISSNRTYAQANGVGYEQSGFYQLAYRQAMYILKYKNLNSQQALGKGYVNKHTTSLNTGGTDTKGMDWGETTGEYQMKCFGIEDFWGNRDEFIDGLIFNSGRILTATNNFNDTGSGYTDVGDNGVPLSSTQGYASSIRGYSKQGFIPIGVGGSATTYFCDYVHLENGRLPTFRR